MMSTEDGEGLSNISHPHIFRSRVSVLNHPEWLSKISVNDFQISEGFTPLLPDKL